MSYFNEDQQEYYRFLARERCHQTQRNLNAAFEHLMRALPEGWEIRFVARADEAEMELFNPDGDCVSDQWDGDSHSLGHLLDYAIRKARIWT